MARTPSALRARRQIVQARNTSFLDARQRKGTHLLKLPLLRQLADRSIGRTGICGTPASIVALAGGTFKEKNIDFDEHGRGQRARHYLPATAVATASCGRASASMEAGARGALTVSTGQVARRITCSAT